MMRAHRGPLRFAQVEDTLRRQTIELRAEDADVVTALLGIGTA
jgi:hypothetical protein